MSPLPTATHDELLRRFVAQHDRPAGAGAMDFASLSPYHRCLLVTDGTVTNLVEAHALEPIRARCVAQESGQPLPWQRRWLSIEPGTATVGRRVVIEGVRSGTAYLHASSVLVPGRLPPAFLELLGGTAGGIGVALVGAAVEHRRELLWFRGRPGAVVDRTYRVFVQGRPALLITEEFL